MKFLSLSIVALMIMSVAFSGASAQDSGKVSGYMFGDYYYVASSPDLDDEDVNGFWFRRIYLTYDKGLEKDFSVRLRLEMANSGNLSSKEKMTPTVKDAYLKWKKGGASWYFGIASSPIWGSSVEKVWGYRSIEKTPADLQKLASSRDFGVAVKGKVGEGKRVWYHLMGGNGSGNSSETNKYKKVMGALGANVTEQFMVEAYAGYEAYEGDADRMTLQGFAAFQTEDVTIGAQYISQTRQTGVDTDDMIRIASGFVRGTLREDVGYFARFDHVIDVNPSAAKISYLPFASDADSDLIVVGVDWEPAKNVHVMPNLEIVTFTSADENAEDPESTVMPRLTVYYKF